MIHGIAISLYTLPTICPVNRGAAALVLTRLEASGTAATDHMLMGMSVTSTGVGCVFLTVTVSTPLSNRAVMPLISALSGNCEATKRSSQSTKRCCAEDRRGPNHDLMASKKAQHLGSYAGFAHASVAQASKTSAEQQKRDGSRRLANWRTLNVRENFPKRRSMRRRPAACCCASLPSPSRGLASAGAARLPLMVSSRSSFFACTCMSEPSQSAQDSHSDTKSEPCNDQNGLASTCNKPASEPRKQ